MPQRSKVNVIIAAGLAVLLGIVYAASQLILLPSYADLEKQDARNNGQRVLDTLAEDLTALDHQLADWAAWDESYAFIILNSSNATPRRNLQHPQT